MYNAAPQVRTTLRFKRWSRKSYASFLSLGKCVTIGCLPKMIANTSLCKQKQEITTDYQTINEIEKKDRETDKNPGDFYTMGLLALVVTLLHIAERGTVPFSANHYLLRRAPGAVITVSGGSSYFKTTRL